MEKKSIVLFIIILFSINLVTASFGFDNTNIPSLRNETTSTTTTNVSNVNSSDYWDDLDTFNSTQMENSGGVLNILETWLTTFVDNWFGGKTTDDLTEGSTNLYDNSSWNESYADTLYSDGGNASWNESYADTLYAPNTTAGIQYLINDTGVYSTYNATYDALESGNSSFNQSLTDTLYAGIEWDYNQTTATYNLYNDAWSSTYNATYDAYATNVSKNYTDETFNAYNSTWDNRGLIEDVKTNYASADTGNRSEIESDIQANYTDLDNQIDSVNTTTNIESLGFLKSGNLNTTYGRLGDDNTWTGEQNFNNEVEFRGEAYFHNNTYLTTNLEHVINGTFNLTDLSGTTQIFLNGLGDTIFYGGKLNITDSGGLETGDNLLINGQQVYAGNHTSIVFNLYNSTWDNRGLIEEISESPWEMSGSDIYYNDGSVGIGVTSPDGLLELQNGDSRTMQNLIGASGSGALGLQVLYSNNVQIGFDNQFKEGGVEARGTSTARIIKLSDRIYFSGGTGQTIGTTPSETEYFTIMLDDGDIGIGTNSPETKLHISGGDPSIRLQAGASDDARIDFEDSGGTVRWYSGYDVSSGNLVLSADESGFGSSNIMVMDDNGKVGIGTSNPDAELHIDGDVLISAGNLDLTADGNTITAQDLVLENSDAGMEGFFYIKDGTSATKFQVEGLDGMTQIGGADGNGRLNILSDEGVSLIQLESTADEVTNNPYYDIIQYDGTTTSGSEKTIGTYSLDSSATYNVEYKIIGRRTGGASGTDDDTGFYHGSSTYKVSSGGTPSIVGSSNSYAINEDQSGWSGRLTPSSSPAQVNIKVTGATNNDVSWTATLFITKVSS